LHDRLATSTVVGQVALRGDVAIDLVACVLKRFSGPFELVLDVLGQLVADAVNSLAAFLAMLDDQLAPLFGRPHRIPRCSPAQTNPAQDTNRAGPRCRRLAGDDPSVMAG
jgi:hypothetical protein